MDVDGATDDTSGVPGSVVELPVEPPSWWDEAPAPDGPEPLVATCERLQADLGTYPDSATLKALAVRDPSGRVVGVQYHLSPIESAYSSGTPAAVIVAAERQAAFIGQRGTRGYIHRAIRMAHRVRKLNRQLARYSGIRHTLGTVTVLWPPSSPVRRIDAIRLALAAAEDGARRATSSTAGANAPPGTGSDPPPLHSAKLAPLLRTGPPLARVRVAA